MRTSIFSLHNHKMFNPVPNAYNQKTEQNYKVLTYTPNQKD